MIVCNQSPPRLVMMQDQKQLTHHWLSCSGWGREHVSVICSYKDGHMIWEGQWCATVNIFRSTVEYVNATVKRITRNAEPEIGIAGACGIRHNLQADWYGSGFGPPSRNESGFCTVLELNWTVLPVRVRTADGLHGPIVNTSSGPFTSCLKWFCAGIMDRCFHGRDPATHIFFHLFNLLKFSCPILLANCFEENSVEFMLIGAWPLVPPKSD
jgi:hypothetical protein